MLQAGAFAISASFMVVFPLLPALQERAHIDTAQLGWIATAGFVAALVAQTLIAPHADRGRERLVLQGSIVVMALSTLAYALGDSVSWFIAGRLGAGLAYGAFMPAAKGLLIRRFPEAPGQQIGRLHAVELAGMALGPVLAVAGQMSIGVIPTIVAAAALTLAAGMPAFTAPVTATTCGAVADDDEHRDAPADPEDDDHAENQQDHRNVRLLSHGDVAGGRRSRRWAEWLLASVGRGGRRRVFRSELRRCRRGCRRTVDGWRWRGRGRLWRVELAVRRLPPPWALRSIAHLWAPRTLRNPLGGGGTGYGTSPSGSVDSNAAVRCQCVPLA